MVALAKELADRIAEYVQGKDWVSHGELINRLGEDLRGDFVCGLNDKRIIFFVGCSEVFADAVQLLLHTEKGQRVTIAPCSALTLLIDGCPVPTRMPWVKGNVRKNGYKKDHFLPVCFRPAGAR